MPHIHEKYDFTASAYIVYNNKILLLHHKKLNKWMQVGGHVELDENPDQTLIREIKEETGLDVEILSEKEPGLDDANHTMLWRPDGFSMFKFGEMNHYHFDLTYFARAHTDKAVLEEAGANDIRWFRAEELDDPQYSLEPVIVYYAKAALKRAAQ